MKNDKKVSPTMLIILDGLGYSPQTKGNAVVAANMPNFKGWLKNYPSTLLHASGKDVGLLPGFIGNSEVGHLTMGSGRIIKSALVKFKEVVDDGSFFKNETLIKNFKKIGDNNALHIMGLLSDAGVHSHQFELEALLELAKKQNIKNVYIHTFLDGRDTPPKSAAIYLDRLDKFCKKIDLGKIATVHGRFYAMDRDNNWDRIKKSYDVLCSPKTITCNDSWQELLNKSYAKDITDEFVEPVFLESDETFNVKDGQIKKGDGVVFLNFRPDRARELTQAFIDPNFNEFYVTKNSLKFFITTTRYKKEFENFDNEILFEKEKIENTLLDQILCKKFIIAETEKYAHVTYFFRGMVEKQLPNEEYVLIPSIKAKNYIDYPKMSAKKITDKVLESLKNDPACFYVINYANPDMVGHSGNFDATVKACEFLDGQLKELYEEVVVKQNGTIFLTADHGNAEEMLDAKTGEPKTSHSNNPVYFIKINKGLEGEYLPEYEDVKYGLSNIAPTVLEHLGFDVPRIMKDNIKF